MHHAGRTRGLVDASGIGISCPLHNPLSKHGGGKKFTVDVRPLFQDLSISGRLFYVVTIPSLSSLHECCGHCKINSLRDKPARTYRNTPLLRLDRMAADLPGIEIYAKAEFLNPGGSVKDRAGFNIILEGERSGKLTKDKILLDATSGNTGIAYAMVAGSKGYKVRLCMPANASEERKSILNAYGVDLVLTDPTQSSDGAIRKCREIYASDPERYFYPDQYSNPANWQAHYHGTANEILSQTNGRITHFVASLGTSGTFIGTSRRLREKLPHVQCVSAQPSSGFHGLEGLKHMATAIVPGIYDPQIADQNVWIDTEDAYAMVRTLAREESLLVGISSGANLVAARRVAQSLVEKGKAGVVVTVLPDSAQKYLSESFWRN